MFEGRPHIVDRIKDGQIAMVINTTEGQRAISDSYTLRRAALVYKVPYYTTVAGARAVVQAIVTLAERDLAVAPLQSYYRAAQLGKTSGFGRARLEHVQARCDGLR